MKNTKKKILSFALCLSLLCMVFSPLGSIPVFAEGEEPEELDDVVAGETLIAEDFSTTAIGSKPDGWVLHTGGWVWNGDKGTAAVAYDSNDEKKLSITSPGGTAALVLPSLGTANYEIIAKVHLDAASGTIGLLTNIKDPVSESNTSSTAVTHTLLEISSGNVTIKDRAMTGNYNSANYSASAYSAGDDVKLTARCYNSSTYFYIDDDYIGKIDQRNPQTVSSLCGFYACGATVSLNYVTVSALIESASDDSGYNADDIRNDVTVKETLIDEDLTAATEIPEGWALNKASRVWNSASSSMSITEGGLAVANNSGDLELTLPSIYTSDYVLTVNLITGTYGGNVGLFTNVSDPYTSSVHVTRQYLTSNTDTYTQTNKIVGKAAITETHTLTDIIDAVFSAGDAIELSVYSYKGYSYFYINGTFAGKFEQYNPDLSQSLCGIYLCGTHVVVTSVTVESIMRTDLEGELYSTENILDEDFSNVADGEMPDGWSIFERTGAWAYNPTAAKTVQVGSAGGKKYLGITCWTGTAAVMLPFNRTSDYVVTAYITPQSNNGMIGLLSNVQYPLSKSRLATHSILYLSNNNNDKKICQYSRVGNNKYDLQEYSDTELLGRSYGTGDLIKLTAYSYRGITYFYINDTYVGLIEQKNAELEYSYCGIFVYGTSVRVNSVTVDKIEENGNTSSINLLGAQLRYAGTSGYSASSDATGIRFVSEFDKNSFLYKNNFESNYSYDEDSIAQMGTVILPSSSLAIGEKLTVHTSGAVVLPVTSDYEQTEDKLTSYTTIIGGDDFDGYYAARSYIKIRNDYYYSNQIERSKSRLATRCYADDSTASAVKDKLDGLFSSSSGYLTGAEVKTLDFTVIGDLHYKQGMYAASVADLETMIGRAVDNDSNFVLHMGDFCNDYLGSKELTNAWMASTIPAYGIYGNHELESSKNSMRYVTPLLTTESASVVWGTSDGTIGDGSIAYYYFDDASGFRVVCTDTNYSWNPTYKVWDHNKTNSYGGPNGDTLYNSLGDKQLRWLEDVLTDAAERDIPCIVLSHATLSGSWEPSPDSEAVQAIFRRVNSIKKGTVMLALNGHNHKDHMKIIDGVTYLDVNMVRNAYWNPNATWHYTDGQTFEYVTYDADGNVVSTEDASLNVLSGAEKTWFTQDPVSCNIKISTAGYIIIDGYQSEWLYGLDPEIDEVTGVMPEIVDRTINYVY